LDLSNSEFVSNYKAQELQELIKKANETLDLTELNKALKGVGKAKIINGKVVVPNLVLRSPSSVPTVEEVLANYYRGSAYALPAVQVSRNIANTLNRQQ